MPSLIRAIDSLYTTTIANVAASDEETREFDIMAYVLHVVTIAPYLWSYMTTHKHEPLVDSQSSKSRRVSAVTFTDLNFADGVSLSSNHTQDDEQLLPRVTSDSNKMGIGLCANKTEVLTYLSITHI